MKINIHNIPGKNDLGDLNFWQSHFEDIKKVYPYPELWESLTIDVYPKRHPDNPSVEDDTAGLYSTHEDRIRLFVGKNGFEAYVKFLAHECGHHLGDEIHFQFPKNKIERDLDYLFDSLLPETNRGRREDFAEMCGVISGKDPVFFDKKALVYSKRLKTLMTLAHPVWNHLKNREYRNLKADSQRIFWELTKQKRVWWWTETVSMGWFGFDSTGRLQKWSGSKWVYV